MQPGETVYTAYVPDAYESHKGFTFWVDKHEFHSEIDADNVLVKHAYGSLAVKRRCDIFATEAEAKEYVAGVLEGRLAKIQQQIHNLRLEEACA